MNDRINVNFLSSEKPEFKWESKKEKECEDLSVYKFEKFAAIYFQVIFIY